MPDRILRAAILSSEAVNKLSWAEEVFYRRLMSVVDDYGRYDGRNSVLRANLYPLRLDHVSDSDLGKWKAVCADTGLVRVYFVDGKEFVEVLKFNQRMRGKPRWPAPVGTRGDPPQSAASCGESRKSAAYTEAYSESESDAKTEAKAQAQGAAANAARVPSTQIPPTLHAVQAEMVSAGLPAIEADKFLDYYGSNGWKVGKSRMCNWRKACQNWKRRYLEFHPPKAESPQAEAVLSETAKRQILADDDSPESPRPYR